LFFFFFLFLFFCCCFVVFIWQKQMLWSLDRYTEKEGVFNSVRALIETSSSR
jgi:hypothetical protein